MNPKRLSEGGDPYYNPDYQYVPAGVQDMIFGLFNPYASELMLTYGYQPPLGTPSITNPGTYIDPGPMPGPSGPPGVFTPPGPVTPLPGTDDPVVDVPGGPDTGGGNGTGTDGPDTNGEPPPSSPPPSSPPPSGPPTGYVSAARMKEYDPFMHSKRQKFYGMNVLAGSRQEVSAEDFNRLLSGIEGKYGQGAVYDPERGSIYQNIDDERVIAGRDTSDPFYGVDPNKYNDAQRQLAALLGIGDQKDERGRDKRSRNPIYTSQRIGDKMYFVEGGKVYSYDVKDINYQSTPGFAEGGAVSKVASTGVGTLFNGYF
jgi:hypothetical protein